MTLRIGKFRGQKSLGPLKISLEMAHKVICPPKKISGTLIVIMIFQCSVKDKNSI
jgi:hypothetical protein